MEETSLKSNPQAPQAPRLHLNHIDGLRGAAALYVACEHFLPRSWDAHNPPQGLLRLLAKVLVQGHFAVTVFIVISGFCLMLPVLQSGTTLRGGAKYFFIRRFWRIAPPFYIAFLFSALLLQAGSGSATVAAYYPQTQASLVQWIGHLLLLQTFIPGGLLQNNAVLWSISVESVIYLSFPLLISLWRRIGPATATCLFLAASYLLVVAGRQTIIEAWVPQYLGAFALGAFATGVSIAATGRWQTLRDRIPWYALASASFTLLCAFCLLAGWERSVSSAILPWLDLLVSVSTVCLLIGLSRPKQAWIKSALDWRPLVFVGSFSYSLYMIHYPLEDIFFRYVVQPLHLGQNAGFALMAVVGLPLILLISYLFFLAFERPFHSIAKRMGTVPESRK